MTKMSNTERIIENVNATMTMEDMPLFNEDKDRIRECLEGNVSFETAIEMLLKKYTHKQVG